MKKSRPICKVSETAVRLSRKNKSKSSNNRLLPKKSKKLSKILKTKNQRRIKLKMKSQQHSDDQII